MSQPNRPATPGRAEQRASGMSQAALVQPTTPLPVGGTLLQLGPRLLQQRRPGDDASRTSSGSRALRPPPDNLGSTGPASQRLAPRTQRSSQPRRGNLLDGRGVAPPAGIDPVVYAAFREYDQDGSGYISREEAMKMINALQLPVSNGYAERAWNAYDTDASGFLDLWEFAKMMDEGIYRNALQSINERHRQAWVSVPRIQAPRLNEQKASRLSAPADDRRSTTPPRKLATNDGGSGDDALAAQRRLNKVLLDRLDLMESLVDTTDACCDTLAALVCAIANIPSFSGWLKVFLTVISLLTYALQVAVVYKLYSNGYKFDPDLISSFIREGFLSIPGGGNETFATRKDQADYFGDHFEAVQESWMDGSVETNGDDDYERIIIETGLCLTDEGLLNGAVNICACMVLVFATVIMNMSEAMGVSYAICSARLEMKAEKRMEQKAADFREDPVVHAAFQPYGQDGSGSIMRKEAMKLLKELETELRIPTNALMHEVAGMLRDEVDVQDLRKVIERVPIFRTALSSTKQRWISDRRQRFWFTNIWMWTVVMFHLALLVACLYASFRAMAHRANSIWACMEASVSIFLVASLDDMILHIVLRHPKIQLGLSTTVCRNIRPDLPVRKLQLLSKSKLSRIEYAKYLHLGHEQTTDFLWKYQDDYTCTGAFLMQPTEMLYGTSSLLLYRNWFEIFLLGFIFKMLGDRLGRFADTHCHDASYGDILNTTCDILERVISWIPVVVAGLVDCGRIVTDWQHRAQKVRMESAFRALLLYLAVFVCMDAFTWHGCIMSGVWGSDFDAKTQKTCYAYSGKTKAALSAGFAAFVLVFFRWGRLISARQQEGWIEEDQISGEREADHWRKGDTTKHQYMGHPKDVTRRIEDNSMPSAARFEGHLCLKPQVVDSDRTMLLPKTKETNWAGRDR